MTKMTERLLSSADSDQNNDDADVPLVIVDDNENDDAIVDIDEPCITTTKLDDILIELKEACLHANSTNDASRVASIFTEHTPQLTVSQCSRLVDAASNYAMKDADASSCSWLEVWGTNATDNEWAQIIYGGYLVSYAWKARGNGWASSVTEDGWRVFDRSLRKAQAVLTNAGHAFSNCIAWAKLITVAMGLGKAVDKHIDIWTVFASASDGEPNYVRPYSAMIKYLAPKWHGSVSELLGFVHNFAAILPPGSQSLCAVAMAHLELAHDALNRNEIQLTAYLSQRAVRSEIITAFDKCMSTGSSHRWSKHERLVVLGPFAYVFLYMNDPEHLALAFDGLDSNLCAYHLESIATALSNARDRLLSRGQHPVTVAKKLIDALLKGEEMDRKEKQKREQLQIVQQQQQQNNCPCCTVM